MKLYVCWGTFNTPRPGGHPCHNAYEALQEAGWDPDVQRTYGWAALPTVMNPAHKPVRELTGNNWVPVLVTDEDEVVQGSEKIVDWARANPKTASDAA
jgi:Glutathione S-transferase, N-terminal domain